MPANPENIINRLQKWGACDVADGLSKLKYPNGGFLEGLTMYSPEFQSGETKLIDQAYTVKFVPKTDKAAPKVQGNYVNLAFLSQVYVHRTNKGRLIKPLRSGDIHLPTPPTYQRRLWRLNVAPRKDPQRRRCGY